METGDDDTMQAMRLPVILAITGASGAVVGLRTLEILLGNGYDVELVMSRDALGIIAHETGIMLEASALANEGILRDRYGSEGLRVYDDDDFYAPPASGSHRVRSMLIAPCSMKTLAAVAHGLSGSLVTRSADVTIKEGRPLIVAPRETPLSPIHLENMLTLARIGVRIVPPIPAFYTKPATVSEMVDFVVGKILDQAGIDHDLFRRWPG